MKKLLVLSAAVSAAVFVACSGGSGTDGGSKFCAGDSECATGSICHPTAKLCVPTCTMGSDCANPGSRNCAAPAGTSTKVCGCTTSALCNTDKAGTICAAYDGICVAKCAGDSDCPSGRTCNTTTGDCNAPGGQGGGAGGGSGGGGGQTACTAQGQCSADGGTEVCDFTTGFCGAAKTCSTSNAQPDTCNYGQACFQGNLCAEMGGPTCGNFMTGSGALSWNPASDNGPVIYVAQDVTDDAAACHTTEFTHSIQIFAYWTQMWPSASSAAPAPKYVATTGSETAAPFRPTSGYSASGYDSSFKINLCATTASPITAGFYFTGGNGFCFTSNGGTAGTTP